MQSCAQMPTEVMTLPSLEPHSYRGTQQHPGWIPLQHPRGGQARPGPSPEPPAPINRAGVSRISAAGAEAEAEAEALSALSPLMPATAGWKLIFTMAALAAVRLQPLTVQPLSVQPLPALRRHRKFGSARVPFSNPTSSPPPTGGALAPAAPAPPSCPSTALSSLLSSGAHLSTENPKPSCENTLVLLARPPTSSCPCGYCGPFWPFRLEEASVFALLLDSFHLLAWTLGAEVLARRLEGFAPINYALVLECGLTKEKCRQAEADGPFLVELCYDDVTEWKLFVVSSSKNQLGRKPSFHPV
ncbi:hypothetical protein MDA_GLEAN10026050 [Myotis davidii]|uniref:Uncharacterized protein n=1 Tax=Myotis davidii TaxID=225400 RepID=L5M2I9_MYODS|nr:hypothetical protein MDA_GLEAN10026050 [Myotis davidii]